MLFKRGSIIKHVSHTRLYVLVELSIKGTKRVNSNLISNKNNIIFYKDENKNFKAEVVLKEKY